MDELDLKSDMNPFLWILTVHNLILGHNDVCTNIILCRKMLFLAEI